MSEESNEVGCLVILVLLMAIAGGVLGIRAHLDRIEAKIDIQ